jgi:hypothetical protein
VGFVRAHRVEGDPQDLALLPGEGLDHGGQLVRRLFGCDVAVPPEGQLQVESDLVERLRHLLGRVF